MKQKGIYMKKVITIMLSAVGLFAAQPTQAQGTTYISNLGQASSGSRVLGSDAWITQSFGTGTNSGGYSLNSVQVLMDATSGSPTGFSISVYSHDANDSRFPGSSLGSLSGPDPAGGGIFSYSTVGISLLPSTTYYVVLTAATPVANGAYSWSFTSSLSANSSDGWSMAGGFRYSSVDGLDWNRIAGPLFQLGVNATVVPEPSTCALVGLGLVGLSFWRHKSRLSKSSA
jgi:hypothetical protein